MAEAADRHPELTISFHRGDSPDPYCTQYPDRWYGVFTKPREGAGERGKPQVGAYQDGCSILALPETYDEYWNGPAGYYTRRKVRKALKGRYRAGVIDRERFEDDIFAINTSLRERQGRPMAEAYTKKETFEPLPAYGCPHHLLRTYGVLTGDRLVAYASIYQVGDLSHIATILGHGDHLEAGIMYLLVAEGIRDLMSSSGTKYVMYNMHDSGTPGLRFFKEQMGFRPHWVNWQLDRETVRGRPAAPSGVITLGRRILRHARRLPKLVRAG